MCCLNQVKIFYLAFLIAKSHAKSIFFYKFSFNSIKKRFKDLESFRLNYKITIFKQNSIE